MKRVKQRQLWMWFGIIGLWMLLTHVVGCATLGGKLPKVEVISHVTGPTTQVYSSLYWLFIVGIAVVAGGVAATIIMPGDDHIPYGIIGGGFALTGLSLFFIVTLPILKWLILGLVCVGIILVIRVVMIVWKKMAIEKLMRTTT